MYEEIRIKYYTIDEFIKDLLATNEIEYICSNMEQIINCSDIQLIIKKDLLRKLKKLNPEKFKKVHSTIVCKMTDIKPDNSITDEDAYLIYKELRDDGIIWLDAKRENLGRLVKDKIAHI